MKYRQLTKEQLEALHKEFASFLATQQIDAAEWEEIKATNPKMMEEELKIFSDIVWESVLSETRFIDHISDNHINLFKCNSNELIRIYIHWNDEQRSFLNPTDFDWFKSNFLDDTIAYYKASKPYKTERNLELFELIEMGGEITQGTLFKAVIKAIT